MIKEQTTLLITTNIGKPSTAEFFISKIVHLAPNEHCFYFPNSTEAHSFLNDCEQVSTFRSGLTSDPSFNKESFYKAIKKHPELLFADYCGSCILEIASV